MNKQKPADWFAFMKQLSATLWPELPAKTLQVSNCFSKLGAGLFKVMHFSSSLWMCQFDGFEVLHQFPQWIKAKLWMSAKCVNVLWQLTVLSACLWVCEWSPAPLGAENRADKCWHRVLDEVLLIKACMFAERHHRVTVTFFHNPLLDCIGFVTPPEY